jgi:tetratricopeptide (TPR) repeat protein/predicted Ser/Thr protein kinase
VTDERWERIESIYHAALGEDADRRSAFLKQACAGDASLERELVSLLKESDDAEPFLETPALHLAAKDMAASTQSGPRSHPGAIGRYRIVRLLGEGGMGSVYQAEQDEPRRTVALKIIKVGFATPERLRRFRQEGQILAGLAHPNIARLLDAGYTKAAAPFLVMEYVEGLPIDRWCQERNLDLPARLRLFQKLCEAVQFAHQNLVVHRDLKPGNVLVTPAGEPKLLDFGIAKLADPNADSKLTLERALTLDYASPEQVQGDPITTASDIYSLGILLHELIARKQLFSFSDRSLKEAVDGICISDPLAPSAIATRHVDEDLDAIVLKAMRKEPQERYPSARALGEDIERHLTHLPVLARHGTFRYIAKKFAWRHRGGVAVSAAVFMALCVAAISVAWEARVARQERDLAQRRFNDVRGLAGTMLFDIQNKLAAIPGTMLVRKDLVTAGVNYLDALAKDGSNDPGLQTELGAAYIHVGDLQGNSNRQNLGDLAAAMDSYAKAERLARAVLSRQPSGPARRLLGDALTAQAYAALHGNQNAKGEPKAIEALHLARERTRSEPSSQDAQVQLGAALQCLSVFHPGKEGLRYLVEEASVFEGMLARDPGNPANQRDAALAHKYIAGAYMNARDMDAAFEHLRRAEELDRACVRIAPEDPEHKMDLAIDLSQWGEYYEGKKDLPKAIQYTVDALAIRRELVSADRSDMRALDKLGYILNRLANLQLKVSAHQALENFQEAVSIGRRLQPESVRSERLASAISGVGDAYEQLGDRGRACPSWAEAVKLYRELAQNSPFYAGEFKRYEKAYSGCSATSH